MNRARVLISVSLLALYPVVAASQNQTSGIVQFFEQLVRTGVVPTFEELVSTEKKIPSASFGEIEAALPYVILGLDSKVTDVQIYSISGLYTISLRRDSERLTSQYLRKLFELLQSEDVRVQSAVPQIIGNLKPTPPPSSVPSLCAFVVRNDRSVQAQISALFVLMRFFPGEQCVIVGARSFFPRSLTSAQKIAILNAVSSSQTQDRVLIGELASWLNDSEYYVRLATVRAISRIGATAAAQASDALRAIARDESENPEIRTEAERAVRIAAPE